MKVLYELYGNTLGDETAATGPPPVELADYQQDAVNAGLAMLERHNGATSPTWWVWAKHISARKSCAV